MLYIGESFLMGKYVVKVLANKYFPHSNTRIDRNAKQGSGGIGIFVHHRLLSIFDVNILDDTEESMLWIKMSSEVSDFILCVYVRLDTITICACIWW